MAHSLLTTVIGSFPKPEYLPIEDWFDAARNEGAMNSERVTENFTKYQENTKESDEQLFIKAAEEVINLQINSGIDIPTDGEVRRENYVHFTVDTLLVLILKILSVESSGMVHMTHTCRPLGKK